MVLSFLKWASLSMIAFMVVGAPGGIQVLAAEPDEDYRFSGVARVQSLYWNWDQWGWRSCRALGEEVVMASVDFWYDEPTDSHAAAFEFGTGNPCEDENSIFWREGQGNCTMVSTSLVQCVANNHNGNRLRVDFELAANGDVIGGDFDLLHRTDDDYWHVGSFLAGSDPDAEPSDPALHLLDGLQDQVLCGPAKPVVQTVGGPVGKCVPGGDFRPRDHDKDDDGLLDNAETALCAKGYPPRQAITFFEPALGTCPTKKDYQAP
ncbi:MAG: hypothetical protein ACPGQL_09990 [Thermoplasmatota archaeon]